MKPHMLDEGDWVLIRQEGHNKFESTWFGPYQIIQKMLLGTYRLQDPNGKELAHLIHGNRLIRANIRTTDQLRKLWASPSAQNQLRKLNTKLVTSDPENTITLERQLLEVDETVPDLQEGDRRGVDIQGGPPSLGPVQEQPPSQGSLAMKTPQKRLLDEIVVQPWPTKRVHRTKPAVSLPTERSYRTLRHRHPETWRK